MTDLNDLPLSQTGQQRRERMLDDLLTHLRTHHRRRRIRRQAIIASPLLVLAIVCVSWYANLRTSPQVQRPPIAQQQRDKRRQTDAPERGRVRRGMRFIRMREGTVDQPADHDYARQSRGQDHQLPEF